MLTTENWAEFFGSLAKALPFCDGILATAQPLDGLAAAGHLTALHRTYLSINRTGLAGSVFELDDRLVASVPRAAADGWTGVKHMTRIDMDDPITASALELLGQVLEQSRQAGLEALIEPLVWSEGRIRRDTDAIVLAAVIAHDMGAPVIKVPVPAVAPGSERQRAVARVVASVGVPVLFLGGPRTEGGRDRVLDEVRDVMEGGGAGHGHGAHALPGPRPGRDGGPRRRAGARPMILTIDFGTTVTKVGLWGDEGLVALARSELTTTHPQVGWAEQDPLRWWTTLVIACAEARAQAPRAFGAGRRRGLLGGPADLRPRDRAGRPDRQGHPVVRPPGGARGAGAGRAHGGRRHQPGPHRDPARRRRRGGQAGLAGRERARAACRRPTSSSRRVTSSSTA